ncbi:hypothetical protein [Brunnivagina elsteri]|uniref:hypothetical protein n=1 Tax=Brunnivagina elsteri TaxID=1247191 RepID=UPI001304438C|nr:hypothetical protein [Calothrix elsteri]
MFGILCDRRGKFILRTISHTLGEGTSAYSQKLTVNNSNFYLFSVYSFLAGRDR